MIFQGTLTVLWLCAAGVAPAQPAPAPGHDPPQEPAPVAVTYLGNEGFLLDGGTVAVLVDALTGNGLEPYETAPAGDRARLERAAAPYDRVRLVLATHHHQDHFDARAVSRFLRHAPRATFVSTPQAVELLRETERFEEIRPRVRALLPAEGEHETLRDRSIEVDVFNLHHGRGRGVDNLGFLIRLGEESFLHVGDTMADLAEFRAAGLRDVEVDVFFVPFWFFCDAQWSPVYERGVRARRLVAMHLPPAAAAERYFCDGGREATLRKIARSKAVLAADVSARPQEQDAEIGR